MSVAEEQLKALPNWKMEATQKLMVKGEFQYGEVTKFLKQLAADLNTPYSQMHMFYYREFQKREELPYMKLAISSLQELKNKADAPADPGYKETATSTKGPEPAPAPKASKTDNQQHVELTQDELERLVALDPDKFVIVDGNYVTGKVVEVRIVDVRDYGAIVETTDGFHTKGLIHITAVRNGEYVPSMDKFFRYNDVLKALILEYDKKFDRLKLSTRHLPLKANTYIGGSIKAREPVLDAPAPTVHPMAEKLAAVKDKIVTTPAAAPAPTPAVATETPAPEPAAKQEPKVVDAANISDEERHYITTFLNGIVGTLTPAAEKAMSEVIKKHGVFKFTMALMQAKEGFKPDLGLIFMKEIDVKIGELL